MTLLIYLYCIVGALWVLVALNMWTEGERDGASPADQRWTARMALLAPVWPLALLWALVRAIGEFALAVTRRKP